MKRRPVSSHTLLGALLIALVSTACNDQPDSSPPSGPDQYGSPTLLTQGTFTGLPSSDGGTSNVVEATKTVLFTTSAAGSLTAAVTWTFPDDTILLSLYPGGCTPQEFGASSCRPLAKSGKGFDGQNTVSTFGGLNAPYILAIVNEGPHSESGAYQITQVLQ